ncbi:glycosyltransferase [Thiospirillum jenense]|uniref:Glycosyltransferase n=1 Tax=Thiospirillum jenense TaxID=1653858 RepID=A0A839HEN8_9GAMM|nr:glycosyltransferase [Thiospirillum jenense]MBB1126934.1 glycosyltransferase [Thiospirillum jenense]
MSAPVSPIAVIVPVYRGIDETCCCLTSILAATSRTPYQLVVIDDASPEPALRIWLDQLAAAGRIHLIRQPINRGFVAAVNLGMALYPKSDVVLLNSDTAVAHDWLDRLVAAAHSQQCVGTVTPFSNAGSVCSYPHVTRDNPWPGASTTDLVGLKQLDHFAATVNAGCTVDLPVGVGFCLLIRRVCLDQVGEFDTAQFGHGYGEEVEFCLRASQLGFRHLLAADVFVAHHGSVSFGNEVANTRKIAAQAQIDANFPDFQRQVAEWFQRDPARQLRRRLDLARITNATQSVVLFITHNGGGGVERHVAEVAELSRGQALILTLSPYHGATQQVRWQDEREEFCCYLHLGERGSDADTVTLARLRDLGVARLHYHQVVGLPERVLALADDLALPYDVTIHDYMVICPHIHLLTAAGRYCGEPEISLCDKCLADRPPQAFAHWTPFSITNWRQRWQAWLAQATRVICPSQDVASRLQRYWPTLHCTVAPHPRPPLPNQHAHLTAAQCVKVLILGGLSQPKGRDLVYQCALFAQQHQQPLFFRVIGPAEPLPQTWPAVPLQVTGSYEERDLMALIALERADVFLFPAQIPETFSYTLSAALQTGLPIVATALGAFIERLANYPLAHLLPLDSAIEDWNAQLLAAAQLDQSSTINTLIQTSASTNTSVQIDSNTHFHATSVLLNDRQIKFAHYDYWPPTAFHLTPAQITPPLSLSELYSAVLDYQHWQYKPELARRVPEIELALGDAEWDRRALRMRLRQVERDYSLLTRELAHQRHAHAEYVALLERERHAAQVALNALETSQVVRWWHQWLQFTAQCQQFTNDVRRPRHLWQQLNTWQFNQRQPFSRRARRWLMRFKSIRLQPLTNPAVISPPIAQNESVLIPPLATTAPDELTAFILLPLLSPTDNAHWLADCLDALLTSAIHAGLNCTVHVLDDAAHTAAQFCQGFNLPNVHCYPFQSELTLWQWANHCVTNTTGQYLLWLDASSQLQPATLQHLFNAIQHPPNHAHIGMITAKLCYADGPLLAAGAVLWRDGDLWYAGRGDDPLRSTFNYLRQLDVAPWGCVLIPRVQFISAGGFQACFISPDAAVAALSLCFDNTEWQVWYQPAAVVQRLSAHSRQPTTGQPVFTNTEQQLLTRYWSDRTMQRPLTGDAIPFIYDPFIQRWVLVSIDPALTGWVNMLINCDIAANTHVSVVGWNPENTSATEQFVLQQRGIELLTAPQVMSLSDALVQFGAVLNQIMLLGLDHAAAQLPLIKQLTPQVRLVLMYNTPLECSLINTEVSDTDCAQFTQRRGRELNMLRQCDAIWVMNDATLMRKSIERDLPLAVVIDSEVI